MASTVPSQDRYAASKRSVALPAIPELYNKDFLDVLIPGLPEDIVTVNVPTARNPMMEALKVTSYQTYTTNGARAYSSTNSATLDAFSTISRYTLHSDMVHYLEASWKEDPVLTLHIIWNLRSIHDGKGEKEAFYRAFGWLYDNHPRTAIFNLRFLVEPVCRSKKGVFPHGYWKDLLNILALATVDEFKSYNSQFLHSPRASFTYRCKKKTVKVGTPESRIAAAQAFNDKVKTEARAARQSKQAENHERLVNKLLDPKYRALYIAVSRLFAEQLVKDIKILDAIDGLATDVSPMKLLKQMSLAGKWAPTPDCSHDRVTNIATAIVELIYSSQACGPFPAALNSNDLPAQERAHILRSFYQRWILTKLRSKLSCPEPLMSSNRWKEIKYSRVPSKCMQTNTPHFFKHDPAGFKAYLTSVKMNKRSISGATLMPHELAGQILTLHNGAKKVGEELASVQLGVVESQWKTLVDRLRESGALENSIAICDVSGSMGNLQRISQGKGKTVRPILAAVSLSLVLVHLAKPPFNAGFITFSEHPKFHTVDTTRPLAQQLHSMTYADWGMNTNLQAVFLKLLLPLAVKNNIKQEDMIKRLFIFSDMQFDSCQRGVPDADGWTTNYDCIEKAYAEAGYAVPQIVYWNLAGSRKTVEVLGDRKGVAMMNGFSPAMLKVFMGEEEDRRTEDAMEWENITEGGESVTVVEKVEDEKAFNPVNVMKKALLKRSFEGLTVLD
ncbi:hypothetical protein JR316_0002150 [Psilocybe cubensis]|uniref:Uncharacterized protein n=2 Tax=Psilocybe cubensis TaxID=181762 RepID=A0A8H7Y7E7_PSICU|nr:hypothetical protein JR316_0002150 [Psilocybe cubensis]KAH9485243.1 hypothetical protein JR316_0002150 [Psilocybe cubensis]